LDVGGELRRGYTAAVLQKLERMILCHSTGLLGEADS